MTDMRVNAPRSRGARQDRLEYRLYFALIFLFAKMQGGAITSYLTALPCAGLAVFIYVIEAFVDNFLKPGNLAGGFAWYRAAHAGQPDASDARTTATAPAPARPAAPGPTIFS